MIRSPKLLIFVYEIVSRDSLGLLISLCFVELEHRAWKFGFRCANYSSCSGSGKIWPL